jgi:hypothetical protein
MATCRGAVGTVGGLLERAAATWPDREGLRSGEDRSWTFAQLQLEATSAAGAVRQLPLTPPGKVQPLRVQEAFATEPTPRG